MRVRLFVTVSCLLFSMCCWAQALTSPLGTGFNTHLGWAPFTLGNFTADVDDMVSHQQKWVRFNIVNGVASNGGTSTSPQLVWNQNLLTEYDNAINYAFSKGLKIYLVTDSPLPFAQVTAADVYENIIFQYHQFLASRYQGKIAVWQPFNEANLTNFKDNSTKFDAGYLTSLSFAIQAAASAIKQANPGILIAANAGGYPPSWSQYFSGLISNIDVIGVDLYPFGQYGIGTDDDIRKYPATIQSLKSQFGKEIIVSEVGVCSGDRYSDQFQTAILPATIAALQLTPVDAIIVYQLRDGNTTAGDCGDTLGIKRSDGTQKPAYADVMGALTPPPSPAVVSWGLGRIDAFMPGEDSNLWHLAWNGSAWAGWESLGGAVTSTSPPAAVSWGPNRIDVFAVGTDNSLQHLAWDGRSWVWDSLGGALTSTSPPAAVSWGANRIDVFAVGTDNGFWHIAFNGSIWTGWESLGGDPASPPGSPPGSPPAVVSWGPNRIDMFIRGGDARLWHRALNGNTWSSWESLGGFLTSAPTAVSWGPNRIDLFFRGGDYGLYHAGWNGNAWSPWHWAGGFLSSAPVAASSAVGRADAFAVGPNRELLHQCWYAYAGKWCGWESLGGVLSSPPVALSQAPNWIDVFARGGLPAQGPQNMLLHQYWNGSTWSGWDLLGTCSGYTSVLAPGEAMPPGACVWADNGGTLLVMQRDGNLVTYTANHVWSSGTVNPSGKHWAVMQGDGNFCVYPNWPAGGLRGGVPIRKDILARGWPRRVMAMW